MSMHDRQSRGRLEKASRRSKDQPVSMHNRHDKQRRRPAKMAKMKKKGPTCEHALGKGGVGNDTDPQLLGFGQKALLLMLAIQQAELHLVTCQHSSSILTANKTAD